MTGRLFKLLGLLQMHRDWSGTELAERLGVTTRTVRRDVERLRALGYPVHAVMGPAGGYRLAAGATMPPLTLDDDEAVAIVLGLRAGLVDQASLSALAKLEQVLPSRLRHRVSTVERAVVVMPQRRGPAVGAAVLSEISAAIRSAETLRFAYVDHQGAETRREAEPHRLVTWGSRWYLVAWDRDRRAWRTFRVDRMRLRTPNGPRFSHRDPPDGDVQAYLRRTMGEELWPHRCVVRVEAPAHEVELNGTVTPIDDVSCRVELATDSFDLVVYVLSALGEVRWTAESPPAFLAHLEGLSRRLAAAGSSHKAGIRGRDTSPGYEVGHEAGHESDGGRSSVNASGDATTP